MCAFKFISVIWVYILTYTHMSMYVCLHACIHMYVCIHVCSMCMYIHIYMSAYLHIWEIHALKYAYILLCIW